jgi:ATP-dependent protease ClpP protease subunit
VPQESKKWYDIAPRGEGGEELNILIYEQIGVGGVSAKQFVSDLRAHENVKSIHLKINSPGGVVWDGTAIFNELVKHSARVTACVDGVAASMASYIAMAADRVEMPRNAFMFIHNPWVVTMGDAAALRNDAGLLEKMEANIVAGYRRHARGMSEDEVRQMMKDETWLSGDEAFDKGFCEELSGPIDIEEQEEEEGAEARAQLDFSPLVEAGIAIPGRVYAALLGNDPEDPYPNEHACRLTDPDKYDKFARVKRKSASKGKTYSVIRGKLRGKEEWEDQAYRYPKVDWPVDEARGHCKDHKGRFEPASDGDKEGCDCPDAQLSPFRGAIPPIDKRTTSTSTGGDEMHFDKDSNLVDAEGKVVMTAADVAKALPEGLSPHEAKIAQAKLLEGAESERTRIAEIGALCDSLSIADEKRSQFVKDGTPIEEARRLAIDEHVKALDAVAPKLGGDVGDKTPGAMANAVMVRAGVERDPEKVKEARTSEFSGWGLQELVRHFAVQAGLPNAHMMGPVQLGEAFLKLVYDPRGGMSMTTGTLQSVTDNILNQSLMKGYNEAPVTYPALTREISFSDLKQGRLYKNSEAPDVLLMPEGQPPKLSNVNDAYEPGQLEKWGRAYSVTEEMIINDRLDVISSLPMKYGRAIRREINFQFWNPILAVAGGPNLTETGGAFFTVAQGNLAAAAAAIAMASLGAGYTAFMNFALLQPDGGRSRAQRLSLTPRYLACGPASAMNAMRFTGSQNMPAATNEEANLFGPNGQWKLVPVIEPLIDALDVGNASPWFLAADPADMDYAVVVTLTGRSTPKTTSKVGGAGEVKGFIFDIEHFFDVVFVDWRGMYKVP